MVILQKEKIIVFFISAAMLLTAVPLFAVDEPYFSFERFDREYDTSYLPAVARKIHINPDRIKISIDAFSSSLQYIKQKNYTEAENQLKHSIKYWPEFLPANFVLARVYEEMGNKRAASKRYKIYLSLLKRLEQGRISGTEALLKVLGFAEFETYQQAYDIISSRLNERGIAAKLKYSPTVEVKPTILDTIFKNPIIIRSIGLLVAAMLIIGIFGEAIVPDNIREIFLLFAIPVVIIAMLWFIYNQTANKLWLIIAYLIYPAGLLLFIARKTQYSYWLKHRKPHPGHWICKHCGAENPNIYKECIRCQK